MNQEDKKDQSPPTLTNAESKANPAPEPEAEKPAAGAAAPATPAAKPAGALISVVAICVALLAAAGSGYVWWKQQGQAEINAAMGGMQSELMNRSSELQNLSKDVGALTEADGALTEELAGLLDRLDRQARQLEELPLRINRLERALDNIPGVADKARSAWLLAEAEYFLRIANAQLSLAGNPDVALRALELADEKIRDLGDPGLTRVRAMIADEMTAVKAIPRPDAEGIVLSLGALAKNLDSLPLAKTSPNRFARDGGQADEASGLARAWQAIVDALLSVIRVKRTDEAVTPLVTAEDEALLIRSLEVDLQIAQLAVIRNQGQLYRDALAAVSERLKIYFDTDASQVQGALGTIDKLSTADLPDELPDISGSLGLLLRLGNEAATP